jgi:hypothetical protein
VARGARHKTLICDLLKLNKTKDFWQQRSLLPKIFSEINVPYFVTA